MNYLLTGATGFIGRRLVSHLKSKNNSITIITRGEKVEGINCINQQQIDEYLSQNRNVIIVNLATVYGRNNSNLTELIECNVILPNLLLSSAIRHKVHRFVNIDSYYSNFPSIDRFENYQLSKKQFRYWLTKVFHEIPTINLYLHHVYGENDNQQKLIPQVIEAVLTKQQFKLTDCEQSRDFLYVADVARAIEYTSLMKLENTFTEIELASGNQMKLRSFLTKIYKNITNDDDIDEILKFGSLQRDVCEPAKIDYKFNLLIERGFEFNYSIDSGITQMLKAYD